MRWIRPALAAVMLTFLVGCDRLPDELFDKAESLRGQLTALDARADSYQGDLDRFLSPANAGSCMTGSQAASFRTQLQDARRAIGQATRLDTDTLTPVLDDNDGEREAEARSLLAELESSIGQARRRLDTLNERVVTVQDVRTRALSYQPAVQRMAGQVLEHAARAEQVLDRARETFPSRRGDLAERENMAMLLEAGATAGQLRGTLAPEFQSAQAGEGFNCVRVADGYRTLERLNDSTPESRERMEQAFAALYRTEERILVDQKAVYSVQVGRSSWDYSGGGDINILFDPVEVPVQTYEYVVGLREDTRLAFKDKNWESEEPEIPAKHWRHLRPADPFMEWPHHDQHDEASFWVQNWDWNHFHKYKVISEGGARVTDWISVDADVYDRYADAMGMAVASKPVGSFADEAMVTPAPPGMNLVGDPRYGEWRQGPLPQGALVQGDLAEEDADGETEVASTEEAGANGGGTGAIWWYFLGRWSALNTPVGDTRYAYSRASHDTFRSTYAGRQAYYGPKTASGARPFGTKGELTRSTRTFQTSTFARTGGAKSHYVPASVRGAGPAGRGGGPGGGGK